MNSYGYDYFTPNDSLYFDETAYYDAIKPVKKAENFSNDIDTLLNDDEEIPSQKYTTLEYLYKKKSDICNIIYDNFKKCQLRLKQKNYENYQLTNQILLLYVLIIFAVLFVFYQRMSINNLNQLIYILKYNNANKLN